MCLADYINLSETYSVGCFIEILYEVLWSHFATHNSATQQIPIFKPSVAVPSFVTFQTSLAPQK